MENLNQNRYVFIDHLRAFIFALLVFDHTIHAYAQVWGRFHFIQDFDRTYICDILFMHNNSIIMPMLFFIFGLFVLPSYQRRGLGSYVKERFFKLGIPYIIGIPVIVPLLVFPRYQFAEDPLIGYLEFWKEVYFSEKIQGGGPFWVLYCLALFSAILIFLNIVFPKLVAWISRGFGWMAQNPIRGFCIFTFLSMVVLGFSDLRWGAPWWVGFGHIETGGAWILEVLDTILNLFHLQGSRFMLHGLYFAAGVGLSYSGILNSTAFWKGLSDRWFPLLLGTILFGTFYIGYSLEYFSEGAYGNDLRHHFYRGGDWSEAWSILFTKSPWVLVRTSLHGIFCLFQALTLLAIFHRFFGKPTSLWQSLAKNAYGIFLFHEIFVIWLQYKLIGYGHIPILIKVVVIFTIGLGLTWVLNDRFRRLPGVRQVL